MSTIPSILPRKTIEVSIIDVEFDSHETLTGIGLADTLREFTAVVKVDGVVALEIPAIRNFSIGNAEKFIQIEPRLKLLEDVLRSADVTGMALVRRVPGGYEVISTDTYTLMSNDPEDRD
jgi:hypothetical protein